MLGRHPERPPWSRVARGRGGSLLRGRATARSRIVPSERAGGAGSGGGRPVSHRLRRGRDRPRRAVGGRRRRSSPPTGPCTISSAGRRARCPAGRPPNSCNEGRRAFGTASSSGARADGGALDVRVRRTGRTLVVESVDVDVAAHSEANREALAAAGLGEWRWDRATGLLTLSRRAARILGRPPGRSVSWEELKTGLSRGGTRPPERGHRRGGPNRRALPVRHAHDGGRAHGDPAGAGSGRAGARRRPRRHGRRHPGHHHPGRGPGRDPVPRPAPAGRDHDRQARHLRVAHARGPGDLGERAHVRDLRARARGRHHRQDRVPQRHPPPGRPPGGAPGDLPGAAGGRDPAHRRPDPAQVRRGRGARSTWPAGSSAMPPAGCRAG